MRSYRRAGVDPALVLVFDHSVSPLWDSSISALKQAVERTVANVPVTHAVAAGSGPSLVDALRTARFLGCDTAVVVRESAAPASRHSREAVAQTALAVEAPRPRRWAVPEIVSAYHEATRTLVSVALAS